MHTASLVVTGLRPVDNKSAEDNRSGSASEQTLDGASSSDMELSNMNTGPSTPREASTGLKKRSRNQQDLSVEGDKNSHREGNETAPESGKVQMKEVPISVVEQRVSNLAQGMLCEWLMGQMPNCS